MEKEIVLLIKGKGINITSSAQILDDNNGIYSNMKTEQELIVDYLTTKGEELLNEPYKFMHFSKNKGADKLLNDLENYPHAFVLASVMDRQIRAERAWLIPYKVSQEIGGFEFDRLLGSSLESLKLIFNNKSLHRFNDSMAENFYLAVQHIHNNYNDDVSIIWKNKPKSATVVKRFLEFKGVGIKIATMATNILVREFKIPLADKYCIDISPDVQVMRVFKRLGFVSNGATNDELIYSARELNPEYPGIFDLSSWEIGRNWCRPNNPDCNSCYLNKLCPKIIE